MKNNNKLIAEFMELPTEVFKPTGIINYYHEEEYNGGSWYEEEELSYNVSWDWLRPVVKKIDAYANEEMSFNEFDNYRDKYVFIHDLSVHNDIKDIYNQVVEFIKEYNDGRKQ
tara:strand:- start:8288 stop:8626 length:339 start_codon:yes stop_codon:yes gene_type:complete